MRHVLFVAVAFMTFYCGHTLRLNAQALPAGKGPGSYIALGASGSAYRSPYNNSITILGASLFVDANATRRLGIEAETCLLRWKTDEGMRSSTFLAGPRVSTAGRRVNPYVKILFGTGQITYPFKFAQGSYFVVSPGLGLDLSVLRGRASVRLVDVEYQDWSKFTFGPSHPYGVSSGVRVRIF